MVVVDEEVERVEVAVADDPVGGRLTGELLRSIGEIVSVDGGCLLDDALEEIVDVDAAGGRARRVGQL